MGALGLGLGLGQRRRAKPFDPASLFAAGQPGAWFDPSLLATLFQDSAGTVAAAVNAPVGRMLDRSGRGMHASQATAAARPTLRQDGAGRLYLEFDGVDDVLATGSLGVASPWERVSAIQQISYTAGDFFYASGPSLTGGRLRQSGTAPTINIRGAIDGPSSAGLAVGVNGVVTERFDGAASRIAVNSGAYATGDTAGGTFDALIIGRRESLTSWGHFRLYGLVLRAGTMSEAQMRGLRVWLGGKAGVAL